MRIYETVSCTPDTLPRDVLHCLRPYATEPCQTKLAIQGARWQQKLNDYDQYQTNFHCFITGDFSECKALKDIYCQVVNVPETHSSTFDNSPIENMTLYVPGESMNAYKTTAPWSGFGKFQTLTTGIEKTETAAKPMITTADGQIAVSGLSGNASIQVLSLDGKLLDSSNATDGIATLNAQPGEVVIVKVGTESYKVVVR